MWGIMEKVIKSLTTVLAAVLLLSGCGPVSRRRMPCGTTGSVTLAVVAWRRVQAVLRQVSVQWR